MWYEIGLDFYHSKDAQQISLFAQQLDIAQAFCRPVSIHCVKAHNECILLIKKKNFTQGGFIHGFSGSLQQAEDWIKLGFKIGIGTVLLKQNSRLRKILPHIPKTSWVMESDSPFMLPENTPAVLLEIYQTAAALTQQTVAEVVKQSGTNAVCLLLSNDC